MTMTSQGFNATLSKDKLSPITKSAKTDFHSENTNSSERCTNSVHISEGAKNTDAMAPSNVSIKNKLFHIYWILKICFEPHATSLESSYNMLNL